MANGWQTVPLGEFLTQRKEFFTIDDFTRYMRARVQSHGKGIVLRDEVTGAEIKTKKQQAARTGEFLVAEIDAKVGGFGIVPSELDGAVVSSHYFLFQIDENKCSLEWLNWFVRYNSLEEQTKAQGSTNYAAIRPNDVLNFEIPLPPLTEQRRIVARIEALAARVAQAQSLRGKASEETVSLLAAALARAYDQAKQIAGKTERLDDLCSLITDGTHVTPKYIDEGVPFLSVKDITSGEINFSNTRFISPEEHASLSKRCNPERDDVLLTKVGTTGFAKAIDVDRPFSIFVSLALLKIDKTRLDPRYTEYMLNSPRLRDVSKEGTRGVGNKNLVLKFIKEFPMPVPPMEEQRRLVAYLDGLQAQVSALRAVQAETDRELSALMPSVLDRAFKGEL